MESLSVKYRPKTFNEVVSQESVIKILTRQIQSGAFKNTYLFSGASGSGKTTSARILAQEINQHVGTPIEIDAASNNGVENVRAIIKAANERAIDSKYKVYIIDECHVISNSAWSAFLKCIEEPPTYTIFIFCTTDPQKVPDTIKNRCQRFNFTRISAAKIKDRLAYICQKEDFTDYDEGIDYISRICKGGMRDAISLLEKCAGYSTCISIDNVLNALGNYSYDSFFDIINHIIDGGEKEVFADLEAFYQQGNDMKLFVDQFLQFCLDLSKYALTSDTSITSIPSSMEAKMRRCTAFQDSTKYYSYIVDKLLELKNMIKTDSEVKATVEVMFLQMTRLV